MRKQVLITIFSALTVIGVSQENDSSGCSSRLKEAETLFQSGYFPDCIFLLETILKSCDFSKIDQTHALELLGNAYFEINDQENAESTVNLLLTKYPHYELNEEVNSESFNRLVKKYEIHPLFTLGAKNTGDWLKHKITKTYSVLDALDYTTPFNDKGYFFTYYGMAEYEFTKNLSFNGDLMLFWSRFDRAFYKDPGFSLYYWERDCYIELPMYLKKYWEVKKNLYVYASGGAGIFYTYRALGHISLTYTKNDTFTGRNADFTGEISPIDVLSIRNKLTSQWNLGIGFGYKIKNLRMFLDARYLGGIGSITNPGKADLIPVLRDDYFYIDNEWKINQFEVGATISYTLINSVKRIRK